MAGYTYTIATASTSDLPRTWLEEHNIPFLSYTYTLNDQVVEDDCRNESRAAVYAGMRAGDKLRTSMLTQFTYEEFFRAQLSGGKDLLYVDMSREISASYSNSVAAAEVVAAEFPERRLVVMDTRCISGGLGILVTEMVKRAEAGGSFDEVLAWAEDNKFNVAHRFTVDDLNYLKEGGRVSNASAFFGTALSIKPVLYVPDKGTLEAVKKCRGRKAALKELRDSILHDMSKTDMTGHTVFINNADCEEESRWLADELRAAHPELGEVAVIPLGVVIGAHTGPGLIAVFYLCDGRYPN